MHYTHSTHYLHQRAPSSASTTSSASVPYTSSVVSATNYHHSQSSAQAAHHHALQQAQQTHQSLLAQQQLQQHQQQQADLHHHKLKRQKAAADLLETFEDFVDSSEGDEYGEEIEEFMMEMEAKTLPSPHYMEKQAEITWKLRKTLILWLIEVHAEYDMRPETLYLAINFLDRCCSRRKVTRAQYQLLGITCLWVAAKYEENHGKVPTLKNLIYICVHTYTERDFIGMESVLLEELEFVLGHPTAETFLKHRCRPTHPHYSPIAPEVRGVARYLMELSLLHRRFVGTAPSTLADACLAVAATVVSQRPQPERVLYCGCGCMPEGDPDLPKMVRDVEEVCRAPPRHMQNKYAEMRFMGASAIVKAWVDGGCRGSTADVAAAVAAAAATSAAGAADLGGRLTAAGGCVNDRAMKVESPVGPNPMQQDNRTGGLMTPPKDVTVNAGGPFRAFWQGQAPPPPPQQQRRGGEYVAVGTGGGAGGVVGRIWESVVGGYHLGHHVQQQQQHHHQQMAGHYVPGSVPMGSGMEGVETVMVPYF
ncbi:hypothetical protein HK101_000886 [Irineochytrium annulatum]|nr:hypothetical protein HK101_000886 [Irineochytrium annulatum]